MIYIKNQILTSSILVVGKWAFIDSIISTDLYKRNLKNLSSYWIWNCCWKNVSRLFLLNINSFHVVLNFSIFKSKFAFEDL